MDVSFTPILDSLLLSKSYRFVLSVLSYQIPEQVRRAARIINQIHMQSRHILAPTPAVDMDSNMIRQAKRNLKDLENVELVQSDFAHVKLTTKLDVEFSNSALHWAHDHEQVFQHFWKLLNCDKTRTRQLLIQCGGNGNLRRILTLLRRVMKLNELKVYFANMNQSWYFAKPDDTSKLLGKIGYVSTKKILCYVLLLFPRQKHKVGVLYNSNLFVISLVIGGIVNNG